MQIYTVIIETWTVPGQHIQSFTKPETALVWVRGQFAEGLLPDLLEEVGDPYSGVHEFDPWFLEAVDRVRGGTASLEDYVQIIDAVNDVKEWGADLEVIESELDPSELILAERERIAAALDEEADLVPCAEDAEVTRSNARLVRADFSYEEADRLAEAE